MRRARVVERARRFTSAVLQERGRGSTLERLVRRAPWPEARVHGKDTRVYYEAVQLRFCTATSRAVTAVTLSSRSFDGTAMTRRLGVLRLPNGRTP